MFTRSHPRTLRRSPPALLMALAGVLLLAAQPVAQTAAPPAAPPATSEPPLRTYAGFVLVPSPTGDVPYYFRYVTDSLLVLGEGLEANPQVTLSHEAFLSLLRTLKDLGALRDTVALQYLVEAQYAPDSPGDLALSFQAPVVVLLTALGLLLALGAASVLYRRVRRERTARARERAQARVLRTRLSEAREAERAHFARELHDGPVQALCAVQMALTSVSSCGDGSPPDDPRGDAARGTVTEVIGELRGLCDRLRPPALEAFGLPAALASLAQRVAHQYPDLDVACRAADGADAGLTDDERLALFRITQEALTNAARHAHATHVEVSFDLAPGGFRLSVEDDGTGPPAREALDYAREGHYGLLGMRERADLLSAALVVERSPLGGTRVAVTRPEAAPAAVARRRRLAAAP